MGGSGLRDLTRSRMAEAALKNEAITRGRVEQLERQEERLEKLALRFNERISRVEFGVKADAARTDLLEGVLYRDFWGRLRWLVTGR